jgi:uncharacterized membrane protein YdfJ with MMPL/SSD domain
VRGSKFVVRAIAALPVLAALVAVVLVVVVLALAAPEHPPGAAKMTAPKKSASNSTLAAQTAAKNPSYRTRPL